MVPETAVKAWIFLSFFLGLASSKTRTKFSKVWLLCGPEVLLLCWDFAREWPNG